MLSQNLVTFDDLVSGGATVQEAFEVYKSSKWILHWGGFNLRKWNTNSKTLNGMIEKTELSSMEATSTYCCDAPVKIDDSRTDLSKLLGVAWDKLQDMFIFDFREQLNSIKCLPCTKRLTLRVTASLFDPLGLLSPFTITLKMLFQGLCTSKTDWDEPLHAGTQAQWKVILLEDSPMLASYNFSSCFNILAWIQ